MSDGAELKEPQPSIHHIERARLPWRLEPDLTECGLDAGTVPTWTRDDLLAHIKKWGKQRTSLFVCMTCSQTASRHNRYRYQARGAENDPGAWESDPIEAVSRACERASFGHDDERKRLERDFRAIAALIEAHHDEFASVVGGLEEAVDLDTRRAARDYIKRSGRRGGRPL
jgi:hypothetical protein